MLDIRMPIGLMFLILGGLLAVYGLTTEPSLYRISLGYNLNLLWGGAMALFGLGMLGWMRLRPQADHAESREQSQAIPVEALATLHL
ncbi:hypothetical protein J7643_02515 [bacterium]|nr:hypothetical protein [bacterium]